MTLSPGFKGRAEDKNLGRPVPLGLLFLDQETKTKYLVPLPIRVVLPTDNLNSIYSLKPT